MKKIIIVTIVFLFITPFIIAQNTPQGMKYQAVARDISGDILANQDVILKIKLQSNANSNKEHYSEVHKAKTNQFGLFSLVIGEGQVENGVFTEIPWSTQDIWMTIDIKDKNKSNFKNISSSKLLAVPYAFHAATASKVINEKNTSAKGPGKTGGVPSQNWSLFGNSKTDPEKDKLGTTDAADLVLVSNNIERLRITSDGEIITGDGKFTIGGNLEVQGDETKINKDLYVGRDVFLNDSDDFTPRGETINYGNFTVERTSATVLTGTLNVLGETNLESVLNVNNESATGLSGTLTVDGITDLNEALNVNNESETLLTGILTVNKNAQFDEDVNVLGTLTTKNLNISADIPDGGFLATFENTNDDKGDGLKIKLGKKGAKNAGAMITLDQTLANFIGPVSETQFNTLKNTFSGSPDITELIELGIPDTDDALALLSSVCTLTFSIGNKLIDEINSGLSLPFTTRDLATGLNGHDPVLCALSEGIEFEDMEIPFEDWVAPYNTTAFQNELRAKVEDYKCPECWDDTYCEGLDGLILDKDLYYDHGWDRIIPKIPQIPTDVCTDLFGDGWEFPEVTLEDIHVTDPLNKDNVFIEFTDKEDFRVGSIKAQSIENWAQLYFNKVYIYDIISILKSFDKVKVFNAIKTKSKAVANDYRLIGVKYASGNGDYAEWLERLDPNEVIGTGDIVAVKGGKITKDLTGAEQVMGVSHQPIVLGNMPEESKEYLGNNIAFMGQIPVKIMGPVNSGDYVVGKGVIAGFGIAVSPHNMTLEDFKYAVGRSWDANPDSGPKMVNTVVGVHNGDYMNILKRYENKFKESEVRLETVEAKVDLLSRLISQPN